MKYAIMTMAAAATFFAATAIQASAKTPGQHPQAANMQVYGTAKPPMGYLQLCQQFPGECQTHRTGANKMELSQDRWAELVEINVQVNSAVIGVTDRELYGTEEMWTYPNRYGDCEDYVLLKRLMLIRRGWSPESLLITVVWDETGQGHAILTATTSHGDFILDNKRNEVLRWQETGYIYEKRQGAEGAGQWVWLRPDRPGAMRNVGSTR
jgi:predicted transglutaminase-like cysteine proteinase